jgi:hypothetical protein
MAPRRGYFRSTRGWVRGGFGNSGLPEIGWITWASHPVPCPTFPDRHAANRSILGSIEHNERIGMNLAAFVGSDFHLSSNTDSAQSNAGLPARKSPGSSRADSIRPIMRSRTRPGTAASEMAIAASQSNPSCSFRRDANRFSPKSPRSVSYSCHYHPGLRK